MHKVTKEEKAKQFAEAKKCYEEAYRLIQKGDDLIKMYMRGISICDHGDNCEPIYYAPYKDMIEVHLYEGIGKFEKLFGVRSEPNINMFGDKDRDRRALCIEGIKLFQIGKPTESRYCYK